MHAKQGGSLYHLYDGLSFTHSGREPATYRMRDGHANHSTNPTRYKYNIFIMYSTTPACYKPIENLNDIKPCHLCKIEIAKKE